MHTQVLSLEHEFLRQWIGLKVKGTKDWQMLFECIDLSRYHNVKYPCDHSLLFNNSTKKRRKGKEPNSSVNKRTGTSKSNDTQQNILL